MLGRAYKRAGEVHAGRRRERPLVRHPRAGRAAAERQHAEHPRDGSRGEHPLGRPAAAAVAGKASGTHRRRRVRRYHPAGRQRVRLGDELSS